MVGLSVILEPSNQEEGHHFCHKNSSQLLSKFSLAALNPTAHSCSQTPPPPLPPPSFPTLHSCCFCNHILLPGKDIYMYKGDRGFCSVECRYRQIMMDEQESMMDEQDSSTKTSSFSSLLTKKGTRTRDYQNTLQ